MSLLVLGFNVKENGDNIILDNHTNGNLSKAASNAIEYTKGQNKKVFLLFNDVRTPIHADDTIGAVEDRYRQISKEQEEAFLASPKGKEYLRQQEENQRKHEVQLAAKQKLLDDLSAKSSFQLPLDMPTIAGIGNDREIRKQLSVGAQWLADNPDKKPFAPGHTEELAELTKLMDDTDTELHSGASFSLLMDDLHTIAEKGFDGYVAAIKANRAKSHQR